MSVIWEIGLFERKDKYLAICIECGVKSSTSVPIKSTISNGIQLTTKNEEFLKEKEKTKSDPNKETIENAADIRTIENAADIRISLHTGP